MKATNPARRESQEFRSWKSTHNDRNLGLSWVGHTTFSSTHRTSSRRGVLALSSWVANSIWTLAFQAVAPVLKAGTEGKQLRCTTNGSCHRAICIAASEGKVSANDDDRLLTMNFLHVTAVVQQGWKNKESKSIQS